MPIALGFNNIQRTGGPISAISNIGSFTDTNIITSTGSDFNVTVSFAGGETTSAVIPVQPVSVGSQVSMQIQLFKPAPNAFSFLSTTVNGTVTQVEPELNDQAIYTINWNSFSGPALILGNIFPEGTPLSVRLQLGTPFASSFGSSGSAVGTQPAQGGIFLGSTPVSRVYLGSQQVWPSTAPPPPPPAPTTWNGSLTSMPSTITDNVGFESGNEQIYLAELIFESNGNIKTRTNNSGVGIETVVGQWSGTNADSSNTEIRFAFQTSNNSSFLTGTTEGYVSLSSTRSVTFSGPDLPSSFANVRVFLRELGASVAIEKNTSFNIGDINEPPATFAWSATNEGGTDTIYTTPIAPLGFAAPGDQITFAVTVQSGPDVAPNLRSEPGTTLSVDKEGPNVYQVYATMPASELNIFFGGSSTAPPPPSPPPDPGTPEIGL